MASTTSDILTPAAIIGIVAAGVPLVGACAAIFGLAWRHYREKSLRNTEVHAWADEVITALEGLVMVCILRLDAAFSAEADKRLAAIAFDTAILVERGRMFFRNQPFDSFGIHKKPAYRGLRPKVLDPIVAAHQIAVRVPGSDGEQLIRLRCLAEQQLKEFVSTIQLEIGRQRTAPADAEIAGTGFDLEWALSQVTPEQIAAIVRMSAKKPA